MGLYAIDCSQCKKPFMWFSGNQDQRCTECRNIPIVQTLWYDCLWELMEKAKAAGQEHVQFADVDKLVVEKSKTIVQYRFKGEVCQDQNQSSETLTVKKPSRVSAFIVDMKRRFMLLITKIRTRLS